MPVLGVQFRSFEARRFQDAAPGQVRVDHNSTLNNVLKVADDRARIDFTFTTSYGALGIIKIEGSLVLKTDPEPVLEQWNKDRNLPPANAQEVHSAILGASVPQAVVLGKDLRLPPPMPIPQVRFQAKDAKTPAAEPGPDAA